MKYTIDLTGTHCHGCVNLIRMSLEEKDFQNVNLYDIDLVKQTAKAEFNSDKDQSQTQKELNEIFEELSPAGYAYENLKEIKFDSSAF
jgi:copper chaperone CopZ